MTSLPRMMHIAAVGALLLLAIPLALTFLNPQSHLNGGTGGGWDWGPLDFLVMGGLLVVAGFALQLAFRWLPGPLPRAAAALFIVAVAVTVLAELSVGAVSQLFALAEPGGAIP